MNREIYLPVWVGDRVFKAKIDFVLGAYGTIELSVEKKRLGSLVKRKGYWQVLTHKGQTNLTADDLQILGEIIERHVMADRELLWEYAQTIGFNIKQ